MNILLVIIGTLCATFSGIMLLFKLFRKDPVLKTGLVLIISLAVIFAGLSAYETAAYPDQLEVHFIDVGQGDAILIKTAEKNILVDGGGRNSAVTGYLSSQGVRSLDLVVGTHPHADHIGGLIDVMHALPVDEVIDPAVVHTTKTFEDYLQVIDQKDIIFTVGRAGMSRDLGDGIMLFIVHPQNPSDSELNNASIVLHLVYDQVSFLLTGDAEKEAETEMINRSHPLNSIILKAGHHGSSTSTTEAFFKAVDPQAVVIMCGEDNRYGHPHRETIELLEEAQVDIYRTDLQGTIVFKTDGETYMVNERPW